MNAALWALHWGSFNIKIDVTGVDTASGLIEAQPQSGVISPPIGKGNARRIVGRGGTRGIIGSGGNG